MNNIRSMLQYGVNELTRNGLPEPVIDTERILCNVLSLEKYQLYINSDYDPGNYKTGIFKKYINQRLSRIPLAYILRKTEFMGIEFDIVPGVLVPRQETELLAEQALDLINKEYRHGKQINIVDLCCGSGIIGLSILSKLNLRQFRVTVHFSDINPECIKLTRHNSEKLNLTEHAMLYNGDMYIPEEFAGRTDIIVCNPPYIKSTEIPGLQPEISVHEPINALDGGTDGLKYYHKIAELSGKYLAADSGYLLVETGDSQLIEVSAVFSNAGFHNICGIKDYSGLDRIVKCSK